MNINYKKPIEIRVWWVDANGSSKWKYTSSKIAHCYTVGILIRKTKKSITIGQSIYKKGEMFTGEIVIPIGCVIKTELIKWTG